MSILESPRPPRADNPFLIYGTATPAARPAPPPVIPARIPPSVRWQGKRRRDSLVATVVAVLLLLVLFIPAPVRNHLLSAIRPSAPVKTAIRETRLPFTALRYNYLSSPFGRRWGRAHEGVDLAAPGGTPIYAASAGTVIDSGWIGGYGRSVLIEHRPGFRTRYAHCARLFVKAGERVSQGRLIAHVGSTGHSTGPHLHFEVIVNDQPRDPARYYRLGHTSLPTPAVVSTVKPLPEDWLRSIADLMNLWWAS